MRAKLPEDDDIAAELGLTIVGELGLLGGPVYQLEDGRVVKFGASREEAAIAAYGMRIDNSLPGLPRFEGVYRFSGWVEDERLTGVGGYDSDRYVVVREEVPDLALAEADERQLQQAIRALYSTVSATRQADYFDSELAQRRGTKTVPLSVVNVELASFLVASFDAVTFIPPSPVVDTLKGIIETVRQLNDEGIQVGDLHWVSNLGRRADGQVCIRDLGVTALQPKHYAALEEHLALQLDEELAERPRLAG